MNTILCVRASDFFFKKIAYILDALVDVAG
jgi:hypothetical protein